jgi:molecular chaperone IbpA
MRQTVGFDRFNDLFETLVNGETRFDNYPPYNIEKMGENDYRITLAVAGFGEDDLEVTVEGDRLKISGTITEKEEEGRTWLHRGIAARSFERVFRLADHIQVEDAALNGGLMTITLRHEVPEAQKPRAIAINGKNKSLLGKLKN